MSGGNPSTKKAFWNDLKLAARVAKRAPVFSAVAIVTIALGVGATTAIFSVVDGVVLKPLPYRDATRLVRISHTAPGSNIDRMGTPDGTFFHYRENASTLAEYALYIESSATTDGDSGATEAGVIQATPSLFSVLGVKPLLGRLFTEEEGQSGAPVVVILTHKFWMSRFGGDSTVIGKPLSERSPIPIVGVLPEWFDFIRPEAFVTFGNSFDDPALIVNLRLDRTRARLGNFMYQAIGRLAPGATAQDANRELIMLMHQMPELYPHPGGFTTRSVQESRLAPVVEPFKNALVGDIAGVLWIIMGAIGLVLLIAMVNVLNLFAVRAESRRREIAVRRALGATGARLSQSFLAESFLLATAGTVLGVMVAASGTGMLLRIAPSNIPRLESSRPGLESAGVCRLDRTGLFAGTRTRAGSPIRTAQSISGGRRWRPGCHERAGTKPGTACNGGRADRLRDDATRGIGTAHENRLRDDATRGIGTAHENVLEPPPRRARFRHG